MNPDGSGQPALRVAAVDMGSNAIRFVAAEFEPPDRWRQLDAERVPVRLGGRVYSTGRLEDDAMARALDALCRLHRRMERLGVQRYRAVTTSAVRESENGHELVARVRQACGLRLEIIGGDEEARLGWLAVRSRVSLAERPWLVADLGGGSLEISAIDGHGIRWTHSHPLGAVRLLAERDQQPDHEVERVRALLRTELPNLALPPTHTPLDGFLAVGGNIDALVRVAGLEPDAAGVSRLSRRHLQELITMLAAQSYEERIARHGLSPDRADVILPAALVYQRVAELAAVEEITVPGVGVKEGLLLDLVKPD